MSQEEEMVHLPNLSRLSLRRFPSTLPTRAMFNASRARLFVRCKDGEAETDLWTLYVASSVIRNMVECAGRDEKVQQKDEVPVYKFDAPNTLKATVELVLGHVGKEGSLYMRAAQLQMQASVKELSRLSHECLPSNFKNDDVELLKPCHVRQVFQFVDMMDLANIYDALHVIVLEQPTLDTIVAMDNIRPTDASWATAKILRVLVSECRKEGKKDAISSLSHDMLLRLCLFKYN